MAKGVPGRTMVVVVLIGAACALVAPATALTPPADPVAPDIVPAPGGTHAITVTFASTAVVARGSEGFLALTVHNGAEAGDTVRVAVLRTPDGWTATVTPAEQELAPGASRPITVALRPDAVAASTGVLVLGVTSTNGADQQPGITLRLGPADGDAQETTTEADAQASDPSDDLDTDPVEADDRKRGLPAPGALLVLVVMGTIAGAARRRSPR